MIRARPGYPKVKVYVWGPAPPSSSTSLGVVKLQQQRVAHGDERRAVGPVAASLAIEMPRDPEVVPDDYSRCVPSIGCSLANDLISLFFCSAVLCAYVFYSHNECKNPSRPPAARLGLITSYLYFRGMTHLVDVEPQLEPTAVFTRHNNNSRQLEFRASLHEESQQHVLN